MWKGSGLVGWTYVLKGILSGSAWSKSTAFSIQFSARALAAVLAARSTRTLRGMLRGFIIFVGGYRGLRVYGGYGVLKGF